MFEVAILVRMIFDDSTKAKNSLKITLLIFEQKKKFLGNCNLVRKIRVISNFSKNSVQTWGQNLDSNLGGNYC